MDKEGKKGGKGYPGPTRVKQSYILENPPHSPVLQNSVTSTLKNTVTIFTNQPFLP